MPKFNPKPDRYDDFIDQDLLQFLKARQAVRIDEDLDGLGKNGDIPLIMEKGKLRFVVTQNSHDAIKWQPGSLNKSDVDPQDCHS